MKPYAIVMLSIIMLAFTSPATSLLSDLKDFRFMSDRVQFGQNEYWQTPEEFARHGVGDCEDFAVYAKSLLDKRGVPSFIFSVFIPGDSHTVLVYKDGQDFYYLNLDYSKKVKVATVSALASEIRRGWNYAGVMRQEGHGGVITRRFNNKEQGGVTLNSILEDK